MMPLFYFLQVQVYVDSLVKKAYDNWEQVVEYDGKSLVDAEQNNNSVEPENELHVESIDFDGGLNHQLQMPSLPMSVTSEHQINSGMPVGGKRFCFLESQFDGSSSLFCSSLLLFFWVEGVTLSVAYVSNLISQYRFLLSCNFDDCV